MAPTAWAGATPTSRRALGGHAERVERPDELRAALERCIASVAAGQAALCEVATHEESAMAGHT